MDPICYDTKSTCRFVIACHGCFIWRILLAVKKKSKCELHSNPLRVPRRPRRVPPSQDGPELANAPIGNQETFPKLVQIDRGQSDRVVPTPIALTQTNLIPVLPAVGQAASVPTLEATQDGRLRYKAILSFVNDIKVVAQTDGIILDILVDEGSAVAKDTIMIQIDNRLAVAEREVASKELESAKLKAEDDSQIKFSVASYEVATSVFNRSQELFAKVVEAQEEWEKKRLEKIKAGFQIDVSKREQLIAQAAVGVNEAKVKRVERPA